MMIKGVCVCVCARGTHEITGLFFFLHKITGEGEDFICFLKKRNLKKKKLKFARWSLVIVWTPPPWWWVFNSPPPPPIFSTLSLPGYPFSQIDLHFLCVVCRRLYQMLTRPTVLQSHEIYRRVYLV
jgi:hypothetical protein